MFLGSYNAIVYRYSANVIGNNVIVISYKANVFVNNANVNDNNAIVMHRIGNVFKNTSLYLNTMAVQWSFL